MTFGLKGDTESSKSEAVIASAPSDTSESTKNAFLEWLSAGNAQKYSPSVIVVCLDRISEYALSKKISFSDLWSITKPSVFKPIYIKLLEVKLLRITDKNTYNVFIVAGQLYLRFLKEKPFARKEAVAFVAEKEEEETVIAPEHSIHSFIDPEDVIAWLVTQPNANGTLYLENVVRQYMGALRSVPAKLEIPSVLDVFTCYTTDELNAYWDIFKGAPNYKQVNSSTSGSFSAGMGCYLRYLQHLSGEPNNPNAVESDVIHLIERYGLEYVDKRDSGGALWVVGGRELSPTMLEFRDAGFPFTFKVGGGRSSDYRDAWWYKVNNTISEQKSEAPENVQAVNTEPNNIVPDTVVDVLNKNYASGFRFDTTYINLLSSASGVEIDGPMQSALKHIMFRRDDGIYFLLDIVADAATRKDIIDFADTYLQEYGCFEIPEFYKLYEDKVNPNCIRNADDFESFYEQIGKSGVRCVQAPYIGNRIARFSNGSVWGTFKGVAAKIISVITEEYYGSCNEDDLHTKFCAFSTDLLGKIIKQCAADELIRVEINDSICYQTFDALGLPENFSEVLAEVLERLSDIGLDPTQDALHTTLSLKLGVNFRAEYNLPDWDTYRRLIAAFYKAEPRREWKSNIFGEIVN